MDLLDAILQDQFEQARGPLRDWGLLDPKGGYQNLRRMLSRLAPPEFGLIFEFLEENLPSSFDPDRVLNNLERYQHISAGGLRPLWLVRDRPFLLRLIIDLFGFSQFLSDVLIRYPHYLAWLGEAGVLDHESSIQELELSLGRALAPFTSPEKRQHASVRWLRREMLRSGVRVMMERTDEPQFTLELSRIAIALIRAALSEAERPLLERFGHPMIEIGEPGESAQRSGFCVVAMGKLGGMELNFSSDVDLLFIYSGEGQTEGVRQSGIASVQGQISNHDYFRRLSEGMVSFLTATTEEGYLYRVDTRLRPDGAEGPLARSIGAFEVYYESSARPWERMALIKSLAVAGDPLLCEQFDRMTRGLVFGQAIGTEVIEEVHALKQRIDAGVDAGDEGGREIKRGKGGIREIEFYIQTLQLLHGARHADLQVRATLDLIPALAGHGHLRQEEADQMMEDYVFLRVLEHRLQMMDLRQTHTLPVETTELDLLARRCGIGGESRESAGLRLIKKWETISSRVHERFTGFFGQFDRDDVTAAESASIDDKLATLIASGAPDKELIPLLAPFGLSSGGAIATLRRMGGRGRSVYLSSRAVELFPKILPKVIEAVSSSARPESSLIQLDALLSAFGSYASLYEIFDRDSRFLSMISRAFGTANSWGQTLIAHPEYMDFLFDPDFLSRDRPPEALREQLRAWQRGKLDSDEEFSTVLARFRRFEALITGLSESRRSLDHDEVTARLSDAADVMVQAAVERAWGEEALSGFAVLAMGKHGSRELNYFSDLDVIFAWDDEVSGIGRERAESLAVSVSSALTRSTPEGTPYNLDTRLRPEGAGAPLAPPLSRFLEYYASRGELWEFQSFMKIRHVAGDRSFGERFIRDVAGVLKQRLNEEYSREQLATAVSEMRRRLERSVKVPSWVLCDFKKGAGGLMDLDFIAQYFQLVALSEGEPLLGKAPPPVFAWAENRDLLNAEDAKALSGSYTFLRQVETRCRLLFETESSRAPASGEKAENLGRLLADLLPENEGAWTTYLLKLLRENRSRFERVLTVSSPG